MYFRNRAQAGKLLALKLDGYKSKDSVVIALSEGSSILAAQIAMHLHTNMFLYLIKDIKLPGEIDPVAELSSTDTFVYNSMFTAGQLEEMTSEYHQYIDQERLNKRHELNVLIGHEGEIDKNLLRHRNVILVSDGLANGASLDAAYSFLKMVSIKRLIIATSLASVGAVDRMHLIADEIICLGVTDNYMFTNHYYDDNVIPDIPDVFKMMRNIAINWER